MTATVLVTGGTGNLGQLVVARLQDSGQEVRVLSRRPQQVTTGVQLVVGDLESGQGLEAAVEGVATVVHCAGNAKGDDTLARNLVRAAAPAGVAHLVNISVVGADRVPTPSRLDRAMFGYFGSKLAAERVLADSGLPFSTLRATQFHDLTWTVVRQLAQLPVVPAPGGFRFQPIDGAEVADRLTELALGRPAGLVPELGGPRAYLMTDLVRSYLRATRRRRPVLALPIPGRGAQALRSGANLTLDRADGRRTWEEYLAARVAA